VKAEDVIVRDLLINTENHPKHNATVDTWERGWDEAMKAMSDINVVLDEMLGGNEDWGGRYHSWLKSFGISPETENGWWSLAAIDRDNIAAFVAYENEEAWEWANSCQRVRNKIKGIMRMGHFQAKSQKVIDLVAFNL
jgi:hypothetical protein